MDRLKSCKIKSNRRVIMLHLSNCNLISSTNKFYKCTMNKIGAEQMKLKA